MSPRFWNIPYAPNPFFTGQEALLRQLAETLKTGQPTALSQPQAISGLGGIGKTQIAVEYAHRHRQDYQAILWVRADTHEALVSSYVTLACLLNLSEKDEQDQTIIVGAVLRWLQTHGEWLLILDNADELAVVREFVPTVFGGHILLTTRARVLGSLARRVEVETMSLEVGALFLLRRAGLIGLDAPLETVAASESAIAREIVQELGGLPLALDQAGAYIEETRCGLAGYLERYQKGRMELLKRRGSFSNDYPDSVATTWRLAFEKVKQQSPAAADLLHCCALLYPDAIPEELFTNGATHLDSHLQGVAHDSFAFDDVIRVPLAYSLIHRDPGTAMLSIHRLVQAVLVDTMPPVQRSQWRECIVRALNGVFPEVTFKDWTRCGRLLPHALVCAIWIEDELIPTSEASHLLHKTGVYLRERGQYSEAEPLLVRVLAIWEQQLGAEHTGTAKCLNNLAILYRQQGKYEQAEPLLVRALAIRERQLGDKHPDTARSLNDLAQLYRRQGKYEQAKPLYLRALAIREKQLGAKHPDTAWSLHNLANLYWNQGKYEQAEPLYLRAYSIRVQLLGDNHPDTAWSLNDLAQVYRRQEKYELTKSLYQEALLIRVKCLGPDHPNTAWSWNSLAELYRRQEEYEQAESLYRRALVIWEQRLGSEHPDTAYALHGLAELYKCLGRYEAAEDLYQQALAIREVRLGRTHPETRETRMAYAAFLRSVGRDAEAAALEKSDEPSAEEGE